MLKQFPRTHLVAACGFAAVAAVALMVSPSGGVEAQRISVTLNLENGELNAVGPIPNQSRPVTANVSPVDIAPEADVVDVADVADVADVETETTNTAVSVEIDVAHEEVEALHTPASVATKGEPSAPKRLERELALDVPPELDWQAFTVKSGDTLSTLFRRAGYDNKLMYKVIQGEGKRLAQLYNGDQLRFGTKGKLLQEVVLTRSRTENLRAQLVDGTYVTKKEVRQPQVELAFATGEIQSSLFIAGKEAGLNTGITMELSSLFGWDIDFVYDIRKGDRFDVLYEKQYLDGEEIGDGRILAANFINRGKKITAILYTDESGKTAYYSPEGKSVQKAFLRAPIDARISSSFNLQRRHPILNVVRPHEGTDYAAATGSPIMAAGDGRVRFKGTKGGYGRTVELQHGDGITTLYAHMNSYARGIATGKTVKQGQVIGYVGSSGMATGPHLHYEFRVNGSPRNSRTVKLPDAVPVPKAEMAKFKAVANKLVARLASGLKDTQLALAEEE